MIQEQITFMQLSLGLLMIKLVKVKMLFVKYGLLSTTGAGLVFRRLFTVFCKKFNCSIHTEESSCVISLQITWTSTLSPGCLHIAPQMPHSITITVRGMAVSISRFFYSI